MTLFHIFLQLQAKISYAEMAWLIVNLILGCDFHSKHGDHVIKQANNETCRSIIFSVLICYWHSDIITVNVYEVLNFALYFIKTLSVINAICTEPFRYFYYAFVRP